MNARRTSWWYYLIAIALGLLGGAGIAVYDEHSGASMLGAPWFVSGLLAVLGVVVLVLALQVHKYATTDPRKRPNTFVNPTLAVYTLVLAKALGLAGAALAGWYGGQALLSIAHMEADYYSQVVLECAIAVVVCLADMVIGIVGEWLCQLPPTEGAEHPKMKKAARSRQMAGAVSKSAE
ncbi:hypothetical protein BLEM_1461 [Bifidobacterium lemurum]|uniref:DUF3180 domain-containing protein n=1 Tax=Bifidobacterium lemurum TaxID=1603886 RepID=A0A261FQ35_9BIFI|nr:DUF3180 domain-containing protein [Bifidobacterium lemurum]OZG61249.1 hypothetical protein BLEM_1461 [Bifidobacterium lemurum]QOL34649.1 DUF3180 domain-containing protein [Bifidobacterium lemurum]